MNDEYPGTTYRSSWSGELFIIALIGFLVTWYLMPPTLRRVSIAMHAGAITAFAALSQYDRPPRTPLPGEVVTAQPSDTVYHLAWWGWLGLALLVYIACLIPKITHHINWHSYQKRPGLFSKTIESERFSWVPPFGTVHMHGCNGPTKQDWAEHEQAAREATYAYSAGSPSRGPSGADTTGTRRTHRA